MSHSRFATVLQSLVAVCTLLAVTEGVALADDAEVAPEPRAAVVVYAAVPAPPAPPAPPKAEWYGWQTLTVDGASTALVGLGVAASGSPTASAGLALTGVSGFALGAPIVHAAHGRWGVAAADLGLRAGAVALGGFVGAEVGREAAPASCNSVLLGCLGDTLDGLAVGATVGAVAASVLDAALLAKYTPEPKETPAPSFSWSPSASMVRGGGTAGVTGTF